jgi:hypothetical protein
LWRALSGRSCKEECMIALWTAAYVDAAYLVSIEFMSLKHRLANDQPSPHHLSLTRNLITCSLVTSYVTQ